MKKSFSLVAAVVMVSQLHAQQDTTSLDPVVITATKTEQKQSTTGKVITVISREQLEKEAGKTLAQVLNEQAGIVINGALNNAGSVQSVFMRGTLPGRTLILLDGIPVNDPSGINNDFDLNLFSINDAERIEICKGAQSTLYGSDAIAGVINIITIKKDIQKPLYLKSNFSYGNKNTLRNNLQGYGRFGKLIYNARFTKYHTNGFSSATSTTNERYEDDLYDGHASNASLEYRFTPVFSVRSFIQYSRYTAGIDAGVFADERDYTIDNSTLMSGAGLHYKKGRLALTANYQYGELKRKYMNDSLHRPGFTIYERNKYEGRSQYAEFYGNIRITDWLSALAGMDYRWGVMSQDYFSISGFGPYSSQFDDTSTHQTSFYASLFFQFLQNKLNVEVGGRTNKHSLYGNNSTYTFNPSWLFAKNFRLFGSIASGFKAPSIYQVYDVFSGNPGLQAEKSVNYEAGIQQAGKKISGRIVWFHRDIDNGIDYDYNNFVYFNFVKQKVTGWELELLAKPADRLSASVNYTMITGSEETQSREDFSDITYDYLLRRPKNVLNFAVNYGFTKRLEIGISGKSVSKRYDLGGYQTEDVLLDNYFILNGSARYNCRENFNIFLDLQNIGNKKFYDLRGFNSIPFLFNAGFNVNL